MKTLFRVLLSMTLVAFGSVALFDLPRLKRLRRLLLAGLLAVGLAGCTPTDLVQVRSVEVPTLDRTFGRNGFVITDLGGSAAWAMVLQRDDQIVAIGTKNRDTFLWDLALVRYRTDGSLDPTFGTQGIVLTPVEDTIQSTAAALQTDGTIVVAGSLKRDQAVRNILLLRYNQNGTLDATFGRNGKTLTSLEGRDWAQAVAIQPDGKIVVLGKIERPDGYFPFTTVLLRYRTDGTLDPSFGDRGRATHTLRWDSTTRALALQADGKILVTGTMMVGERNLRDFGLVRYNPDGTLDSSFGHDGVVVTDLGASDNVDSTVIQADGRIIVGGHSYGEHYGHAVTALARYNIDGTLDPSFGKQGVALYDLGLPSQSTVLALQADGKLVIAGLGYFDQAPMSRLVSIRCNPDGSRDMTFAGGGTRITNPAGDMLPQALVVQRDGRIVVAGYGEPAAPALRPGDMVPHRKGPFDFTLVRFAP